MRESEAVARVFFCEDACFGRSPLSAILRDAHCEPIAPRGDGDLEAALDALLPPPELMILPISPDGEEILEMVRRRRWLRMVPILALSSPDPSELDLWRLRGFGVVGLIDRRASAEHVRFRLEEVIDTRGCSPRDARVPCCFIVEVEGGGAVTTEYAVSFSIGGIGLASGRALEPNTEVRVRLTLTGAPGRCVEVRGRVVRRVERADGRHDVGIVFLPLPPSVRDAVAAELQALLLVSGLQLGQLPRAPSPGAMEDRSRGGAQPGQPSAAARPEEPPW